MEIQSHVLWEILEKEIQNWVEVGIEDKEEEPLWFIQGEACEEDERGRKDEILEKQQSFQLEKPFLFQLWSHLKSPLEGFLYSCDQGLVMLRCQAELMGAF